MRNWIPLTCLACAIASSGAHPAPVKADPKAERAKLEKLWKAVNDYPPSIETYRAIFHLIEHPGADAFLDEKIRPLNVSKEQITQWFKDLNSDYEDVRNTAYWELDYYDPRLALSLGELVELATSDFAKRSLLSLLLGNFYGTYEVPVFAKITLKAAGAKGNTQTIELDWKRKARPDRNDKETYSAAFDVGSIREMEPLEWRTEARAAMILGCIGTRAAHNTLARLAVGHPDALPVRTARGLLREGPPYRMNPTVLESVWSELDSKYSIPTTGKLIDIANNAEAIPFFKSKYPAIKASEKQIRKWLGDFGSEEEAVRKSAFESMLYYQPLLTLSVPEQLGILSNDRCRSTFSRFYRFGEFPSEFELGELTYPVFLFDGLYLHSYSTVGDFVDSKGHAEIAPLKDYDPKPWHRARLAIIALEHNATDAAIAVLKQLADGHPDILPTKEAKAALKKLGKD